MLVSEQALFVPTREKKGRINTKVKKSLLNQFVPGAGI